jgi:hypothetical protein
MRSGEYGKALQSYDLAIDKQKEALQEMSRAGLGVLDGRINFVLGSRFYLKGLAMYHIVKTIYDNYTLLKERINSVRVQEKLRKSIELRLQSAVNMQQK